MFICSQGKTSLEWHLKGDVEVKFRGLLNPQSVPVAARVVDLHKESFEDWVVFFHSFDQAVAQTKNIIDVPLLLLTIRDWDNVAVNFVDNFIGVGAHLCVGTGFLLGVNT